MSDAILLDSYTVAICRITTKLTVHWWEGSAFTTAPPTSGSEVTD
jgi:hypothetical protein